MPSSPPLKAAALESRRRPPLCFSGPWQEMQDFSKIGETWAANSTFAAARAGPTLHTTRVRAKMRNFTKPLLACPPGKGNEEIKNSKVPSVADHQVDASQSPLDC